MGHISITVARGLLLLYTIEGDQGYIYNAPLNRKYDSHGIERQPSEDQDHMR